MQLDGLHPNDADKVRRLAEALFDVTMGRMAMRDPLVARVENLMACTRDGCRIDGADAAVTRLLAKADPWYGPDSIIELILTEIEGWQTPSLREAEHV